MSSHREAPEISKDPVADNTDVYAFVSPDHPDTVTLISNFVPLQDPPGGPNFFEFGDDVLYSIYIDNDGDGLPEISYVFNFSTELRNPNTFLYNTGQITSLDSSNWNKRQFYSVTRVDGEDTTAYGTGSEEGAELRTRELGEHLACPPCNIGPRSTPNYAALGQAAVHGLPGRVNVFAGQRTDGFDLRPRRPAPVPEPARDPDPGGSWRGRHEDAQYPHDRAADPDLAAHRERFCAQERAPQLGGDRGVERGQPAQGAHDQR